MNLGSSTILCFLFIALAGFTASAVEKAQSLSCAVSSSKSLNLISEVLETSRSFPELENRLASSSETPIDSYVNVTQRIIDHLVNTKQISEADGRLLLENKIFSSFGDIFFRYILLELHSKNYSKEQAELFLVNFTELFESSEKVSFAKDVIRRMIFNINDSPKASSVQGIQQAKEVAEALGISISKYRDFLNLWRFLLRSDSSLMIEFVINEVSRIRDEMEIIEQEINAVIELNESRSIWQRLGGRKNSLPNRKYDFTIYDRIPSFDFDPFSKFKKYGKSSILRAKNSNKTINDYEEFIEKMDRVSNKIEDVVFFEVIDYISLSLLKMIAQLPDFVNYETAIKEKINYQITFLEKVEELTKFLAPRVASYSSSNRELIDVKPESFGGKALEILTENRMSNPSKEIENDLRRIAALRGKITNFQFFAILNRMLIVTNQSIDASFLDFVLTRLQSESKYYYLNEKLIKEIVHILSKFRYILNNSLYEISSVSRFNHLFDKSQWGRIHSEIEIAMDYSKDKALYDEKITELQNLLIDNNELISKETVVEQLLSP